jgi:SnoaL-like domain
MRLVWAGLAILAACDIDDTSYPNLSQGHTAMTALRTPMPQPTEETAEAAEIVERFLVASMVPDPETAARHIAPDLRITFTGGRVYSHPRETALFNAGRYKWVKKKMERSDVVAGLGETVVYNLGTLYGEWPDGTPFEGNRYVDRFVVRNGKIVQMDVWNDSAERILTMRGISA